MYRGSTTPAAFLPEDYREALLVGRVRLTEGPTPVLCRRGRLYDISRAAPTVSELLPTLLGDLKPVT